MSQKHPVVVVTGSSGAGTSTVKKALEAIFHRHKINPATIEGDSFGNEDSTLKTTKLPLYKEFTSDDRDWAWYLRGAANYSSLEQTVVAIFHHQIDRASI